jgi:hypothetical protein
VRNPVVSSTPTSQPISKLSIRCTLRIDQSELCFSCNPDADVSARVKWASGGFLVSGLLGGEETLAFVGTVSGVTVNLSHAMTDQGSCIEAGAKDLAFSVVLGPSAYGRNLSIVIDTSVSAQFRLDDFSAWLIFNSVWLDNTPKLDMPIRTEIAELSVSPCQKLRTVALVRLRKADFDADLVFSRAALDITPIIVRTLSDGQQTEVDVSIGSTSITGTGEISGDLESSHLNFNTVRQSNRAAAGTEPTVLQMCIEGGDLRANLFAGEQNIARFL